MSSVLKVSGLTKYYDQFCAVDHLDFSIQEGEILGFLGPNGAGKSTTIQMLLGLTSPDAGSINYFDLEFSAHREVCLSRINFSSTYSRLQGRITVWQNLRIYAGLYQVKNYQKRIEYLLSLLEIEHLKNKLFWHLSSGQQTRVILAKALVNSPKLLLLDEPTASLDPDIIDKIIDLILRLKQQENISILFTSHNMEEVTRLCDRVIFLSQGKKVAEDTPLNLTKQSGKTQLVVTFDAPLQKIKLFLKQSSLEARLETNNVVLIPTTEERMPQVLFDLKKAGIWITNIDIKKPTLEDVFLAVARTGSLEDAR